MLCVSLNCRYLHPYTQLRAGFQTKPSISNKTNWTFFQVFQMWASETGCLVDKWKLLSSEQSSKTRIAHVAIFHCSYLIIISVLHVLIHTIIPGPFYEARFVTFYLACIIQEQFISAVPKKSNSALSTLHLRNKSVRDKKELGFFLWAPRLHLPMP